MRCLDLKTVYKMKSIVFLVLVVCFAWSQADDPGCSLLGGNLHLKRGEAFEIGEACLRFRCVENDTFKVSMGCEIKWRGAPSDFYQKEIKQLAENVKKGYGCQGSSVPNFST